MSFVNFDESTMELYTNEGVTTNEEQGIYTIEITLTEDTNDITETYTIQLTILEAKSGAVLECEEPEELICYTYIFDGQEIENCECELPCKIDEVVVCQSKE